LVGDLASLDAFQVDARLRHLVRLEQQLDAELGSRLSLVARDRLYWMHGFTSMEAYAREHLGISPRKARALLRLERVCHRVPAFAHAYREGELSWVQAHTLIPVLLLGPGRKHEPPWIDWALRVSVRRLRDDVDRALLLHETDPEWFVSTGGFPDGEAGLPASVGGPLSASGSEAARAADREPGTRSAETLPACSRVDRQIGANARAFLETTELFVHGPGDVIRLLRAVLCTVRRVIERQSEHLPSESEAFDVMLEHVFEAWGDGARVRAAHRVFARDGWRCTAPGCSSFSNLHDHHIVFRSHGGSNDLGNRTTLCAWHHLRGVHAGRVRCAGTAPEGLRFELGLRRDRPPLAAYVAGDRVTGGAYSTRPTNNP
jgi:hypothetical protein